MVGNLIAKGSCLTRAELDDLYPTARKPDSRPTPGSANRGRCMSVNLSAGLYNVNGGGDRQFSLVVRIGRAERLTHG
jgi:hypothetical protein